MKNDYLWDGGDAAGEPDPEVQQIERLLSEFRGNRQAPELPALNRSAGARLSWRAVAAGIAVVAAGVWLALGTAPEGWQVDRSGSGTSRLAVGETLETGAGGHATLNVGEIGVIEVEPNSRLRLIRARKNEHRMALDHGLIHAMIWAPPRSFVVDMPSAAAIDLGCYYTLEVAADGAGLVTVMSGGRASSAMAASPSFPRAPCAGHVWTPGPARRIAQTPLPRSARRWRTSISLTGATPR